MNFKPFRREFDHPCNTLETGNESRTALLLVRMEEVLVHVTMFKTVTYFVASIVYPGGTGATAKQRLSSSALVALR